MTPSSVLDIDDPLTADLTGLPTERLEAAICQLSAELAAAECRWLVLLGEFDRRRGWQAWDARGCADWLSRLCGISRSAAYAKVAVARALPSLPRIRAAFGAGELSYSLVRALVRHATPTNERDLLDLARAMPASMTERFLARYARVKHQATHDESPAEDTPQEFHFSSGIDDDGSLVFCGRVPPEHAATVRQALTAARDHLNDQAWKNHHPSSAEDTDTDDIVHGGTASNLDALVLLADTYLTNGPTTARHDRYQTILHLDADLLTNGNGRAWYHHGDPIDPDLAAALTCDTTLRAIYETRDRTIIDAGRTTRTVPPAMRRLLHARDGGCRYPGCTQTRFVQAHHIRHWINGGETRLENLIELCAGCHHLVHRLDLTITLSGNTATFTHPDGTTLADHPPRPAPLDGPTQLLRHWQTDNINPDTPTPNWDGRTPRHDEWSDTIRTTLVNEGTLTPATAYGWATTN